MERGGSGRRGLNRKQRVGGRRESAIARGNQWEVQEDETNREYTRKRRRKRQNRGMEEEEEKEEK